MHRSHTRDRDAARQWARDLLIRSDWVILDTETTGLDNTAEVVQIAILGGDGAVLLDTLVKPTGRIPASAIAIHGITDAMVADAPAFLDLHPTLETILGGKTVVAYNAAFDERMLRQTALRNRAPGLGGVWQCAMEQYARYVGQVGPKGTYTWQKLPRGPEYRGEKHQAIQDCLATLEVIRGMAGAVQARLLPM